MGDDEKAKPKKIPSKDGEGGKVPTSLEDINKQAGGRGADLDKHGSTPRTPYKDFKPDPEPFRNITPDRKSTSQSPPEAKNQGDFAEELMERLTGLERSFAEAAIEKMTAPEDSAAGPSRSYEKDSFVRQVFQKFAGAESRVAGAESSDESGISGVQSQTSLMSVTEDDDPNKRKKYLASSSSSASDLADKKKQKKD